jgi:hypothetical protein
VGSIAKVAVHHTKVLSLSRVCGMAEKGLEAEVPIFLCSECLYGGCTSYIYNVSFPWYDLTGLQLAYVEDCCALCRLRQDCKAWELHKDMIPASPEVRHMCWLKYAANPVTYVGGLVPRWD